jgi:hypothetical protein
MQIDGKVFILCVARRANDHEDHRAQEPAGANGRSSEKRWISVEFIHRFGVSVFNLLNTPPRRQKAALRVFSFIKTGYCSDFTLLEHTKYFAG